jgi:hypothetical protein
MSGNPPWRIDLFSAQGINTEHVIQPGRSFNTCIPRGEKTEDSFLLSAQSQTCVKTAARIAQVINKCPFYPVFKQYPHKA